jgi:threonylcarbamoyladenosine tRNA methylthiotransferase MtaB
VSGVELITLGCRLNLAESDTIARLMSDADDLIVVNSCAVTQEAVRNTRQAIRRARRDRPGARIVVTGCAAEINPAGFEAMPEVERVVRNADKLTFSSSQRRLGSHGKMTLAPTRPGTPAFAGVTGSDFVASFASRTRAFVAVQNGCDHRCTFCIIPYGRGPSRSVPAGVVIDGIKRLVDQGCAEIVLTGVDVTSYGPDLPGAPTLGLLVERILRHVPGLKRLRLSSLDSVEIDDRLHDIIVGEPRFMPHLHMSFQSGDDMILKRMKRRHSRAEAIATVHRIKAARPDVAIGADLIAGFPTESAEMAANNLSLIDECDIVMGHIFPYSPRPGTPAARMPQVPGQAIKARAQALRDATARRKAAWLHGLIGTEQRVLFERGGLGHAENFAPVRLISGEQNKRVNLRHPRESGDPVTASELGSRVRGKDVEQVKITGVDNDHLAGTPA